MMPLGRAPLDSLAGRGAVTFFLDLDGTIAPFVDDPSRARVTRSARAAIRRLRRAGHPVILVTGRRARDAARVAGADFDAILGSHGAERLDRRRVRPWLGTSAGIGAIARAAGILSQAPALRRLRIETKGWSLAVHSADSARVARIVRARLGDRSLSVRAGRRVVDVRAPGVDKGKAVLRWLASARPAGPILYAGDDVTDEDAFRALVRGAFTVVVGRHASGAQFRAAGPEAFGRWLLRLAERIA